MIRPTFIFLYIYIYILEKFNSESSVPTCIPTDGEKKKFTCTLNSPNDVTNYGCDVAKHTCTASRISYTEPDGSSTSGILMYQVLVNILEYTKDPVTITVSGINSSGERHDLATSIELNVQYEPTELPRLDCQTATAEENNFQSTSTCFLYSSKDNVELQNIDGSNCEITKTSTNPESDGFLSKRTYTVTIQDSTKTCDSSCTASVQIQDPKSDKPFSFEFSHHSSCSGHSIDCSHHDDTTRIITCQIIIPYDYVRVEFKSSKDHVELTSATASYDSTNSKVQVQHVIRYHIQDLQSIETNFDINYEVVQTDAKNTLTGNKGSPYTYKLLSEEILRLECNPDDTRSDLQYNQKAYKCSGRSTLQKITLKSKDDGYTINPDTNEGVSDRNTFKHVTFPIIISPNTIKCNEVEHVEIYFTENSEKRTMTLRQTITCENPTITPQNHDSDNRKITFKVSALSSFEITEIRSQKEIIVVKTWKCSQPSGTSLETTCAVDYESHDFSTASIRFKMDVKFKHSDDLQKTITTQIYYWARDYYEGQYLKCKESSTTTTTPLEYYQKEYICSAKSLNSQIKVDTTLNDLYINTPIQYGCYEKKIYSYNFKIITSPYDILCSKRKMYTLSFNEGRSFYTSSVHKTITCPNPDISVNKNVPAKREITWNVSARYKFEINRIVSKENRIIVTPNQEKLEATKDSTGIYHAYYKISYESTDLSVNEIDFQTEISFRHSENFEGKVITDSLKWTRTADVSPSIDCSLKEAEVPLDIKKFVVSCYAITSNENFQLTIDPTKFVIQETRQKKTSYKAVFKWDNHEIVVEDIDLECNVEKTMTISYIDTTGTLSDSIKRTARCPEPTVICYGNDVINRNLKCKFSIKYPVHEIKISSENANVAISPQTISKNIHESDYDISYTVTDPLANTKKFMIKLDFYHKINKLLHSKQVEMEFKPKKDEMPKLSCKTKEVQPISSIGTVMYTCDVRAKAQNIQIQTSPATYRINPEIKTLTQAGHFYQDAKYEISLTPISMKCGHSEIVELSFTENKVKYSSNVNHTTTCPVPTITCDKHDMFQRIISCNFRVAYQFDEIKVSVNSERISLNSNNIPFLSFTDGVLMNHKITYIITGRITTSEAFTISFQVLQGDHQVVHEKTIGFRYFVKADEISKITCHKSTEEKKRKHESETYECVIVSQSSKVNLEASTDDYTLSPTTVVGNLKNGIYVHENFMLTVTPKVVKCGQKNDVGVFFIENSKRFEFIVRHTTVCSDPMINCKAHDLYKREITCIIDVEFQFSTIELNVTPSAIVEINVKTTISYAEYISNSDHAHKISYELKDLQHADHHFNIEFTVKHDNDVIVTTILKTFQYVLKLAEMPHISCDQKKQTSSEEFESITYKCESVSHVSPVNFVSNVANYAITDRTLETVRNQEVYQFSNKEISIKPTEYSCNLQVPVKISLDRIHAVPEFTVIHKTSCPEPIIKCETHDLNTRIITCSIKIYFNFKQIEIRTSSTNINLLNNEKVEANDQRKYDRDFNVNYEIVNLRNTNHNFDLIFDIIQKDGSVIFRMIRHFRYKLTRDEIPYIKCNQVTSAQGLQFYQTRFSCEILSLNKEVLLEVIPKKYKISRHSSVGGDHKNLYKHTVGMIIVEPTEIVCDRLEKVGIQLIDIDNKNLVEYVDHSTKCPDPILTKISDNSAERKIVLKVEADYNYKVINVKPDKPSFTLSTVIGPTEPKEQKWRAEIEISYKPEDWSIDTQEFLILVEVGQKSEWKRTIVSDKFTCNLRPEEKPQISCDPKTSEISDDFTQKVFRCHAITRQSALMLSLSDENYKIMNTKGLGAKRQSVYHWTDHEVVIQDMTITCNILKSFDISLTDYSQNIKYTITMQIRCPTPEFSVKTHDKLHRIILYNVESKFPRYNSQINSRLKIVSFAKTESSITKKGRKWESTIKITYAINNLLNEDFTIQFSLLINQGTEKIGILSLPFEYELHDNEKRQISCEAKGNQTSEIFAVTEYNCYVVGKTSLSITVEPTTYSLTHERTTSTKFVNIFKWENVSVRVEDKSIICNKTINLTLTNSDGGDADDKYSTIVQHTTICEQIYGDCWISRNDRTYIFCNFTSNIRFNLRNFSCSESFNCSRSTNMEKSSENWNEFVFELSLSSTETYIEFDFNVTLEHSPLSSVPLTFKLEYVTESKMMDQQKPTPAKIVTSFSHSVIYIAIFAVLLTYLLIRRLKGSMIVYEHSQMPRFDNL